MQGVRFYKSAANSGTHVGNLWTSSGTRLATATFADETPSGWQEVLFDAPVAVVANTTYVVSYHTNVGHYSASGGYFGSLGVDRPPLRAPASATVGGNGVYLYGATAFPTQTFNATNYWVDVVFDSTPDTTKPVIADVTATPVDGSVAVISWSTTEGSTSIVDYSTDSTFPPSQTLSVSDAALVMSHSLRITGLHPDTRYFFRLKSIDPADNQGTWPPAGPDPLPGPGVPPPVRDFTTPSATLRDTTSADFSAGTATSTYVSETGDGEVILAPMGGAEFSGSVTPANWSTNIWSDGGSAVVDGGRLIVDGARVAQEQLVFAGHSLEFVATFTGDPYQHSGFGQSLGVLFEPVALFSTSWVDVDGAPHSGGSLAVRSSPGGDVTEASTNLGASFFNAPHRYRIDWQPGAITYYVDGVQVASHAVPISSQMRPVAASDYSAFSGKIVVDWMRTAPYATSGTFLSRVYDASAVVDWDAIQWTARTPEGTALSVAVRTGDTAAPDETWTGFAAIAAPGPLGLRSRYIQYRAVMTSVDPGRTPELEDIAISSRTNDAPAANPDSFTVDEDGSLNVPAPGLLGNDTDGDNDALTAQLVLEPSHGALTLAANGSFTYSPEENYVGTDVFRYKVNDGAADSVDAAVQITVTPVNDAPSFVIGADQIVLEDAGPQTVAPWTNALSAGPPDESAQALTFIVSNTNGALFAIPPAITAGGTLAYTPAPNANGSARVTVRLHDDGGTANGGIGISAPQIFTITVSSVNDAPSFVRGANQTVARGRGRADGRRLGDGVERRGAG